MKGEDIEPFLSLRYRFKALLLTPVAFVISTTVHDLL